MRWQAVAPGKQVPRGSQYESEVRLIMQVIFIRFYESLGKKSNAPRSALLYAQAQMRGQQNFPPASGLNSLYR